TESFKITSSLVLSDGLRHSFRRCWTTIVPVDAERAPWNVKRVIDIAAPGKTRIGGRRAHHPHLRILEIVFRAAKRNECSVFLFPSRVLDHHYGLGSYLIDYGPIPVYQLRSYKGRLSKKILQRMREGTFTSSRCGNRSQQSSKIVGHLHPHLQSR